MNAAEIFPYVNTAPLPIWIIWMAAPRSRPARALAASTWSWVLLGLAYAGAIGMTLAGPAAEGASFFSLSGVMALFDTEWGAFAGWIHYLCFDLFVGRWILNDAPEAGRRLTPILFLTLMFGPLGLLSYLALRPWIRGGGGVDR